MDEVVSCIPICQKMAHVLSSFPSPIQSADYGRGGNSRGGGSGGPGNPGNGGFARVFYPVRSENYLINMKTVFVIDDVIDKEIQDLIEDTLLGTTFAWWKNDDITYPTLTEKDPKGKLSLPKIMDPTSNYYNHDVIRLCHHILEGVCDELNIKDIGNTDQEAFPTYC